MAYNIKGLIKLIRPHDYIKNLFIFAPLFFSGEMSMALFFNALIAFVAFSAGASAVYILNDYQDIEHDRQHPKKRLRPLASGTVTKAHALCLMLILFIFSITLANSLSIFVLAYICTYLLLNVAYSFYLKNIAILDIAVIAIGFVLRLFVGAMATHVALSMWIVMMTFLLALFLALAKRRHDMLIFINTGNKMREVISGYNIRFIDSAMMIMAAVMIVSYILYTTSEEVVGQLHYPSLYLTAFFVIVGVMRYLQITFVENGNDSPTKVVFKDRFMQVTILVWLLSFAWIIYL